MQVLQSFGCLRIILVIFYHLELFRVIRNVIGEIIVPPTDEEVVVSQVVTFKCRTNIKTQFPVEWYHLQFGRNKFHEHVYEKGHFYNGKNYGISGNTSDGEFNLVISNVKLDHAGRYTCRDSSGSERRAELIVYESYPNIQNCLTNQPPDGFVGANDCGIPPDTIRLSCNISYRGNLEPILEWKQGSETLSTANMKTSNTSIISSIELRADEIRSPDFQCRVRYLNSNIESKFTWMTTITVRVLTVKTKNYNASCRESSIQSFDCALTTLPQCSYMWIKGNSGWSFSGSLLNLTSADVAAIYTCHAECLVRDTKCILIPAKVAYTCDKNDKEGTNIATIIVVIHVVCAIIVVIAVIVVRKIRRRRNEQTVEQAEEIIQMAPSA